MTGKAELIERAVVLPPGPELSAVLAALPWEKVPNSRLVEVLQARNRQLSHDQAELWAGMVEVGHAVALETLPGERGVAVARAERQSERASHEIAAGLTWTPVASDRELTVATAVRERLPLVFASLQRGHIDRGKAQAFVEYLDPANGDLTEEQARRLCERYLPAAPGLTRKQLADRLYRALAAIDPGIRRRRYERAVQQRGVAVYLDPRTGTASLVGEGLPADEAAAAAQRNDRMVEAAKRAGHPGTRGQIGADIYLGMLTGEFHGLTEAEIIDRVLARHRPEDNSAPTPTRASTPDTDDGCRPDNGTDTHVANHTADSGAALAEAASDAAVAGRPEPDGSEPDGPDIDGPEIDDEAGDETAEETETRSGERFEVRDSDPADVSRPSGEHTGRWAGDRVATREGIEIRLGLGTAAGLDDRPGEIPGLGPVGGHLARDVAAAQRRGTRWLFAIVDTDGYLLLAGSLRRRPHTRTQPRAVRGGVVELHLTLDELQRYVADPAVAAWHGILAEIAQAWHNRDALRRRLADDPRARFARGALANHVRIRDRSCIGPGCTRAARRSDLDHTHDHHRGGNTVQDNIGPACKRHHADKSQGWRLSQSEPGLFRWVSPLGRVYRTRGEPVRPDLPDPEPAPNQGEESAAEVDQRLRRYDPRILHRPTKDPPRPPPPDPPDDEPPPF